MFASPGAIAFKFGVISIHWYGIIIALAFITGLFITSKIAQKIYSNEPQIVEHIWDLSTYLLIGALLGARIYYILFNLDYYSTHINEAFMIWQGGISIHGAIIGGFITGTAYTKIHKLNLFKYADLFAFGLIIGQAIGRWGNFFNSEAFGKPTNLPWKLYIPEFQRPELYANNEFFHPTFLYESITNLIIFAVLYFIIRPRYSNFNGVIFFSYLIMYSIFRILIESVRIDSIYNPLGIPIAIWASLVFIAIGITGIYIKTRPQN